MGMVFQWWNSKDLKSCPGRLIFHTLSCFRPTGNMPCFRSIPLRWQKGDRFWFIQLDASKTRKRNCRYVFFFAFCLLRFEGSFLTKGLFSKETTQVDWSTNFRDFGSWKSTDTLWQSVRNPQKTEVEWAWLDSEGTCLALDRGESKSEQTWNHKILAVKTPWWSTFIGPFSCSTGVSDGENLGQFNGI